MREQISSEIQSRAEKKSPGYKEAQQKYAKEYRMSVHCWSYGRLIESIHSQAAKTGISTELAHNSLKFFERVERRTSFGNIPTLCEYIRDVLDSTPLKRSATLIC